MTFYNCSFICAHVAHTLLPPISSSPLRGTSFTARHNNRFFVSYVTPQPVLTTTLLRLLSLTRYATASSACARQPRRGSRRWHEAYPRRFHQEGLSTYQFSSLISCPENSKLLLYFCIFAPSRRMFFFFLFARCSLY